MTPDPTVLAWIDLETTGLDPTTDLILEVACLPTDIGGSTLTDEPFHRVIHYPDHEVATMRDNVDPFVRDMHDRTGLWGRLPGGTPLWVVEDQLRDYIAQVAPKSRTAAMAGSSIGALDVPFVRVGLPSVDAHLHYRTVDVTALRVALAGAHGMKPLPEEEPAHEALADVRRSLDEYRHLMLQVAHADALHVMTEKWHRACNAQVNLQEAGQALMDRANLLPAILTAWEEGAPDLDDASAREWMKANWPALGAALETAAAAPNPWKGL